MKKVNKKSLRLLASSAAIISTAQIVHRYLHLADMTFGILIGIGTGFMLLALLRAKGSAS